MHSGSPTEQRIGDRNPAVDLIGGNRQIDPLDRVLSLQTIGPLPFISLIPNPHRLHGELQDEAERLGCVSLSVLSTQQADARLAVEADGRVAVIVPTYNVQGLVSETLASIAQQDYGSLEVIIVDDGSEDATAECIRHFMRTHSDSVAMRFIQIPHMGNPGLSRNIGLYNLLSPGVEYVAFMDGDDLYATTTALRSLVDGLRAQPSAMAAFGDYDWISEEGRVIARPSGLYKGRGKRWRWRRSCELTWDNIATANLSTYHLQCLMVRVGAPLLSYRPRGEDEEYYAQLFNISSMLHQERLDGILQIPELIAHYRKRRNSLSFRPLQNIFPQRTHKQEHAEETHTAPLFYSLAGIPKCYVTPSNISRWKTKTFAKLFWRAIFSGQFVGASRFMKAAASDPQIYRIHMAWILFGELLTNTTAQDMALVLTKRTSSRFINSFLRMVKKRTTRDVTAWFI